MLCKSHLSWKKYRLSTLYHESILGHNNRLVAEISNPPNVMRKLKPPPFLYRACSSIISG
jgi:hypothetical protein